MSVASLALWARDLGGEISGGQILCPGPQHSEKDRSLSVRLDASVPDGFVVYSHSGDDAIACRDYVRAKVGLPPFKTNGKGNGHKRAAASPIRPSSTNVTDKAIPNARLRAALAAHDAKATSTAQKPASTVIAAYDYSDFDGTLLYQNVRFDPKDFRQRRPDGTGGWVWGLGDVKRVPFRLLEMRNDDAAVIHIAEGEKDALRLVGLGLCATSVASWTPEIAGYFKGRDVVVLPDHDATGARKALAAADALHGVAASIRIVFLPDLTGEKQNKDVNDWLDNDPSRTTETLVDICRDAPLWAPDAEVEGMAAAAAVNAKEADDKDQQLKPLALTYFADCKKSISKRWILKNLLAYGETSGWVGPPGSGKSALLTEIAVHCASVKAWRGHKAKGPCGVLVIALERADLYRRRLSAYELRDQVHDLPIAVASTIVDVLDPNCVDLIAATAREAERQFGCGVGLIVIDTYAKAIAANGGDEDKARDQNRAAANLTRLHACIDVHVALVGHTGKDERRGARGSNAQEGHVDLMAQIGGEAVKEVEVTMANDLPVGPVTQFTIQSFELGRDEDGEPIETGIISADHADDAVPWSGKRKRDKKRLKPKETAAIRALFDVIADGETVPRPENVHVPVGVTSVTRAIFRDRLKNLRIINPDGSYRTEFDRICVTLKNAGLIGTWEEFVWPVTSVTNLKV